MANLLGELVYLTLADARATSSILAPLFDAELTSLITEAQRAIDTYIGYYRTKAADDQTFIFPTEDDDEVPQDIMIATVRVTEQLYLEGKTLASLKGEKIVGERNLSRAVTYSDKQSYHNYVATVQLPKKVVNILRKYKNNFMTQVL